MKMSTGKLLQVLITSLALAIAPLAASMAADERQSLEELRNTVINLLQALVDQGVITRDKAAQMVKAAQDKAAADAAAVAKSDEGAVRVPYVPQIVKDEIAKQVAEQVKPDVVADVVKDAKTEKWGVPGALPDWLTRTQVTGSVTLREEDVLYPAGNVQNYYLNYYAINQAGSIAAAGQNAFEDVNVNNARFRGRARLAVDSTISDSVTAGIRLATGNTSDLVSETQTLDGTAPYSFGVDELYVRLDERNAQRFPWLTLVGGQVRKPVPDADQSHFSQRSYFHGPDGHGTPRVGRRERGPVACVHHVRCASDSGNSTDRAGQVAAGRRARDVSSLGARPEFASGRRVLRLFQRHRPAQSARQHGLQLYGPPISAPGQHLLRHCQPHYLGCDEFICAGGEIPAGESERDLCSCPWAATPSAWSPTR